MDLPVPDVENGYYYDCYCPVLKDMNLAGVKTL